MKRLNSLLILALVAIFTLSLAGCGAGAKTGASGGDITVAGVVFQEDQFMKLMEAGYAAAAKEEGAKFLPGNTSNDQGKEANLINTYVTQKVAGIAIAPLSSDASIAALEKADKAGMKVAVTNISLTNAPFIVSGYTSDNGQIGGMTGKAAHDFIKDKLGGKANIAILQFKSQVPEQSAARVKGFQDALKDLPDAKIVADQDAWLQDMAVTKATDILTAHPEVNVIFAANDGGTIGSVMAVKNKGLAGKVYVFGIDTGDQQITMLKDSDDILQAITGQDPYGQGYNAMKDLITAIKTGSAPNKGVCKIASGALLSRADPAGIDKFLADLKARLG